MTMDNTARDRWRGLWRRCCTTRGPGLSVPFLRKPARHFPRGLLRGRLRCRRPRRLLTRVRLWTTCLTDYGETMTALFRDKTQGDLVRGFAVQHIGLYAQALSRRGAYNPDSPASGALRKALFDASGETGSGVAAAAFRSLADMTAFDPQVDAERLDYRLVVCAADGSASLASRIMAVQLCGERGLGRIRLTLERLLADSTTPHPLRLAAGHSLGELRARRTGR